MKKSAILTAIATAVAITSVQAAPKEKCVILDKNGRSLIKAHKADCASATSSCAGQNKEGDPNAWILVPKGKCKQINEGNYEGLSKKNKDKIKGAS